MRNFRQGPLAPACAWTQRRSLRPDGSTERRRQAGEARRRRAARRPGLCRRLCPRHGDRSWPVSLIERSEILSGSEAVS